MALVQHKRNQDALNKARQDDIDSNTGNGLYALTFKNGTTTIRILPPWSDKGMWYEPITEHFIASKKRSVTCSEPLFGRCPVCEHGAYLAGNGHQEEAKNFRPSTKYLVNALVLSEPNGKLTIKDGIKVFKLPSGVKATLLDFDVDASGDGWGDITDYFHGVNVKVDRSGQGLNTKYSVKPLPTRVDIIAKLQEEGIDPNALELQNLDEVFAPESYEASAAEFAALMGETPTEEAQPVQESASDKLHAARTQFAAPVAATTPLSVGGFKPASAPRLNVTIAPPAGLPKRG